MAIKREDLSEEQKVQLKKVYRNFKLKVLLATLAYISFIFASNLVVVALNLLYIKEQQFVVFMSLGTAIIAMLGLHKTIEEQRHCFIEKCNKIASSK